MPPYGQQGQPDPYQQQPYGQPSYPPQDGQYYGPQQPYQGPPPGYQQMPQRPLPPDRSTAHNWAGITGLILGVLALLCDLTMFLARIGIWLAIIGIVISGVGITKAGLGQASNRALAITGMILNLGAVVLSIIMQARLNSF